MRFAPRRLNLTAAECFCCTYQNVKHDALEETSQSVSPKFGSSFTRFKIFCVPQHISIGKDNPTNAKLQWKFRFFLRLLTVNTKPRITVPPTGRVRKLRQWLPIVGWYPAGIIHITWQQHVDTLHQVQWFLQPLPTGILQARGDWLSKKRKKNACHQF